MLNHLVACCLWASIEGVSKQNQYFFQWRVSAGAPPPPLSLFPLLFPAGPDFLLGPPPDLTVGQRLIPLPGCLALHQRTPQLQNCLLGSCAPFAATQLAKMMDPALLGWCLLCIDIPGNKSPIWVSIWGKLESWIFMNQSKSLVLRIKKNLISIENVSFTDIYTKKILADIHILDEHLQKQQKSIDMNNVKISVIDIWNICLWLQNSKINIVPFQYLWYSCTSIKGSKSQVLSLHIGLFLKQQSFSAQQVHQLAVVGLVAGFSDCFSVS